MTVNTNRLTEMIKEAPEQSEALASSIGSVTNEISEITKDRNAVQEGVAGVSRDLLINYLENTKMAEVGGDAVVYGGTFGTIGYGTGNITDWHIDSTSVPIYEYLGVGWDGDAAIIELIEDYDFANDFITRPLTTGATYGYNPNITSLDEAKDILEENKDKIDESIDVFSRYAT